ncbi:MAG: hypothetical protein A4E73_01900 [Syntrophaceae bacterium PtaU1.Bin231]|nr:MAG: hypothetical protein A4E73_01900 [Syntrophaceae bacterium PtaU1.Bin231]
MSRSIKTLISGFPVSIDVSTSTMPGSFANSPTICCVYFCRESRSGPRTLYWIGTVRWPPPIIATFSADALMPGMRLSFRRMSAMICSWLRSRSDFGVRIVNMRERVMSPPSPWMKKTVFTSGTSRTMASAFSSSSPAFSSE